MTQNQYVSRRTQELAIAFDNARSQFEQAIHNPAAAEPDTRACAGKFLIAFAQLFSRAVETVPTDEREQLVDRLVKGRAKRDEFYARFSALVAHVRDVHSPVVDVLRGYEREWVELEVAPESRAERRARLAAEIVEHIVEHGELFALSAANHINCTQFAMALLQEYNDHVLSASVIMAFSSKLSGL